MISVVAQEGVPEVGAEARQDHHELADEARGAGRPAFAMAKNTMKAANRAWCSRPRRSRRSAGCGSVVEHADAEEERARDEAVRHHLHHAA